jgi:hypothetical protein
VFCQKRSSHGTSEGVDLNLFDGIELKIEIILSGLVFVLFKSVVFYGSSCCSLDC